MTTEKNLSSGQKLAAILWFTAAGLSLAAGVIRYANGEGVAWVPFAAALFLGAMGSIAWKRARRSAAP
ncbi:MAG: hypothetical protein ABR576_02255 [Thermoanaerobaculia bacterium]